MEDRNPVEMTLEEVVQDDAAFAPENSELTLEQATAPDTASQETQKSEPGWIKRRVESAVEKRLAEVESRLRAEYETKMAPMQEAMYERQADQLVADGEFKTRERALEYVRLKNGALQPVTPEAVPEQTRDAQGRFMPRSQQAPDPAARAQTLYAQAEAIQAATGVDVLEAYNSDPEAKRKVLSGEWSFIDVYNALPEAQSRIPSPARSANNGSLADVNILKMSQAQRAKLNDTLAKGGVVNFAKK